MNIANGARRTLINIGKLLPFAICFFILLTYAENILRTATSDFVQFEGCYVPDSIVSWAIAEFFEYDCTLVCVSLILSIAVETCKWNKWAVAYSILNLAEKHIFTKVALYEEITIVICFINIFICLFLLYNGIKNKRL